MNTLKSEEKTWGALTHILGLAGGVVPFGNVFGPLIMWQLKRNESRFVDENGKSALNFQISFTIYMMALLILFFALFFSSIVSASADGGSSASEAAIPIAVILFIILFAILAVAQLALMIIGTIKASNGEVYRYPLSIRFVK